MKKPGVFKKVFGKVKYLSFEWQNWQVPTVPHAFDSLEMRKLLYDFIDEAINQHQSVMIISNSN